MGNVNKDASGKKACQSLLNGVLIEIFHRELLVGREIETEDLILLEVQLLVG